MRLEPFALLIALAACGTDPVRYAVPEALPHERVRIAFRGVEVLDVSLPLYAESEEIFVEGPGGAIVPLEEVEWADDPRRAVTLELSRALAALTDARVAAEPWPYDSFPGAQVSVRMTRFVAGADGHFRIAGTWHAGGRDETGDGGRERTAPFEIAVPWDPDSGVPSLAAARGAAVDVLAREIATRGL